MTPDVHVAYGSEPLCRAEDGGDVVDYAARGEVTCTRCLELLMDQAVLAQLQPPTGVE